MNVQTYLLGTHSVYKKLSETEFFHIVLTVQCFASPVCIHLSQVNVLSKRLNVLSHTQCLTMARRL